MYVVAARPAAENAAIDQDAAGRASSAHQEWTMPNAAMTARKCRRQGAAQHRADLAVRDVARRSGVVMIAS